MKKRRKAAAVSKGLLLGLVAGLGAFPIMAYFTLGFFVKEELEKEAHRCP